jgi:hypothetical protein
VDFDGIAKMLVPDAEWKQQIVSRRLRTGFSEN